VDRPQLSPASQRPSSSMWKYTIRHRAPSAWFPSRLRRSPAVLCAAGDGSGGRIKITAGRILEIGPNRPSMRGISGQLSAIIIGDCCMARAIGAPIVMVLDKRGPTNSVGIPDLSGYL
jgi:hypothetical protein